MSYAELAVYSNFSFLRGASHPEEMVEGAKKLGLPALAITDQDGLYGVVKAHLAAKEVGVKLIIGAEITLDEGLPVTFLVQNLEGYRNLCRIISHGRTRRPKGEASLPLRALEGYEKGLIALLRVDSLSVAKFFRNRWEKNFYLEISRHFCAGEEKLLESMKKLSRNLGVGLVATNQVHTHVRDRQALQDVLVCIREKTTLSQIGRKLFGNAERTLKSPPEMKEIFADIPEAIENTLAIAEACTFKLEELSYQFPEEDIPEGYQPITWLRELTLQGAVQRYKGSIPRAVRKQIERELALIEELEYPGYFLTIHSIVQFAKSRNILCQGRGSAANSIVCYCLGITAIDPVRMDLLFERFISRERNEPPDIDVDFERERREEVLQHIYQKYGRDRAAMVCEVIAYRSRLAIREVGKVLGLSLDQVDRLARVVGRGELISSQCLQELGLDPQDRTLNLALKLAGELEGFPRHLSIHTGGFAITRGPIYDLVPVENAAMENRTVVQWDKDDLAAAGILKVDLLSLGMLSAIARTLQLVGEKEGKEFNLASIPAEDAATYAMLSDADSVGVFQVESRAQMSMLPRLKPKTFYDLVVEVAIIRPGPIVGKMVHPYLRRRQGIEPVSYPHPVFQPVLERTLGVTLFQEQVMRLAVAAAGFTLGEADGLRRAMGHKRSYQKLMQLREHFIVGLARLGLTREEGEKVFQQFEGFAHYGFPESHAASFALLAYASAYLKRHYPAAFVCGLLNSQPMGFYAPHTLLEDARRHGVPAFAIDVQRSSYDCTLEPLETNGAQRQPICAGSPTNIESMTSSPMGTLASISVHAPCSQPWGVRLGLRMVRGLQKEAAREVETVRKKGSFCSLYDLWQRTSLSKTDLARLAAANALVSIFPQPISCREALWQVYSLPNDREDLLALIEPLGPKTPSKTRKEEVTLPSLSEKERIWNDYQTAGVCVSGHPLQVLRAGLDEWGRGKILHSQQVAEKNSGQEVWVAGMAIVRQRPGTAKGMFFITLEDEYGLSNIVVDPNLYESSRKVARQALFLLVKGKVERTGQMAHVKAQSMEEIVVQERISFAAHDFH